MQPNKIKVMFLIFIISIFGSVNICTADSETDELKALFSSLLELGDEEEVDTVSEGDDITVTDEEVIVGDITSSGTEYTSEPEFKSADETYSEEASIPVPVSAVTSEDDKILSVTGNGYVEKLPTTGPAEVLLLVFSFLIAGVIFIRKKKIS